MYQFMIPAKAQCIRDIGAIRGSNKHSQGGSTTTLQVAPVADDHVL